MSKRLPAGLESERKQSLREPATLSLRFRCAWRGMEIGEAINHEFSQ
jgi:hypothetical protein